MTIYGGLMNGNPQIEAARGFVLRDRLSSDDIEAAYNAEGILDRLWGHADREGRITLTDARRYAPVNLGDDPDHHPRLSTRVEVGVRRVQVTLSSREIKMYRIGKGTWHSGDHVRSQIDAEVAELSRRYDDLEMLARRSVPPRGRSRSSLGKRDELLLVKRRISHLRNQRKQVL